MKKKDKFTDRHNLKKYIQKGFRNCGIKTDFFHYKFHIDFFDPSNTHSYLCVYE